MRHITTRPNRYGDLLESETLQVTGLRRTRFDVCSIAIVPEGREARQKFQGPMVPGPWGFTTPEAIVIDSSGLAAAQRSNAESRAIPVGEPFTVEGLPGVWTFRDPRRFEGDGAKLEHVA